MWSVGQAPAPNNLSKMLKFRNYITTVIYGSYSALNGDSSDDKLIQRYGYVQPLTNPVQVRCSSNQISRSAQRIYGVAIVLRCFPRRRVCQSGLFRNRHARAHGAGGFHYDAGYGIQRCLPTRNYQFHDEPVPAFAVRFCVGCSNLCGLCAFHCA